MKKCRFFYLLQFKPCNFYYNANALNVVSLHDLFSSFLTNLDAAWDRSSPSPSLRSTTSYYTSDSARSTPQTSPACRRRQPPLPLPKPITTGGRSRRQIFEHSSSLGSSARSLVSPNRSLGSPSRSISPATSDHSSKGMQMFLRQMEKLSRYSDDEGSCHALHDPV